MMEEGEWQCWEITNCGEEKNCPVGRQQGPPRPCWEIARDLDDYRTALNVCKDCIVFLIKQGKSLLSEQEFQEILLHKVNCVLSSRYSAQAK